MQTIDDLDAEIEALMDAANAEKEESENADENSNEEISEMENKESEEEGGDTGNEDNQDKHEDTEDENDESEDDSANNESVDFEPVAVNYNGQEITLDSEEEVEAFNNKKIETIDYLQDYDSSPEQILMETAGISQEDLALLADIKDGKVGAMKKLAESNKIDLVAVDEFEGSYSSEIKPVERTKIDVVLKNVARDKQLQSDFNKTMESLPQDFIDALGSDAQGLANFVGHIKTGLASDVLPKAAKASALNGKSLLDNYIDIGTKQITGNEQKDVGSKKKEQKRKVSEKEKNFRKRASTDKDNKQNKNSSVSADDIWNMTEAEIAELDLRD